MAQVFNKIYVDVRTKNDDIITAVQNDSNSRFLDVYLLDNGLPINLTGHEVRIYCKKADGKEIYNNGVITEATNGRCQFELTDQALAVAQDLEVQIVIYYNNVQILQSLPFTIHVVKSLISSGSVESSNEYGALVILFQNIYEAHALMTTMVQNQGEKGAISEDRDIETFWQSMEYVSKYLDTDLTDLLNAVLAESNVDGVIDRLGNTADTGATAITGTVMGKLNNIIGKNQKFVGIKSVTIAVPAYATNAEVFRVTGAGTLLAIYGAIDSEIKSVSITYDTKNITYTPGSTIYLARPTFSSTGAIKLENMGVSNSTNIMSQYGLPNGLEFNESLVITATNIVGGARNLTIFYGLYE